MAPVIKNAMTAVAQNSGKTSVGILLTILIGLGSWQLNIVQGVPRLQQQVNDLSGKLDDKYDDIRGQVESHYRAVDQREEAISQSLASMSSTLATQGLEISRIRQQLDDAKTALNDAKAELEHPKIIAVPDQLQTATTPPVYSSRPPPPPPPSIPILTPLLNAFSPHEHRRARGAHR